MGRYYKIVVGPETAAPPGNPATPPSGNAGATWTNQVGGKPDPGAQKVEFDIQVAPFAQPASQQQAMVKVWGVSLREVAQASDFNGSMISVYGGMQNGLPLATGAAGQSGLLVSGQVLQAFGNWMGVNQTVDFVISSAANSTQENPAPIVFKISKGQKLGDSIKQALASAYPKFSVKVDVSDSLVWQGADNAAQYGTLQLFGDFIKRTSQQLDTAPNYPGVDMFVAGTTINVFDGTTKPKTKKLAFQDFVGQPTWLGVDTATWNMVMRADLAIGDVVELPPVLQQLTLNTPNSASFARNKSTFTGQWVISYVRHIGDSRGPNAQDWITNFQAYSLATS